MLFEPAEHQQGIEAKITASLKLLDSVVKEHKPIAVVGLLSGGDDSLPACAIAAMHSSFSGMLHINTGIGVEQTREHVRTLCKSQNWKLWEYKATENTKANGAPDPIYYEKLVMRFGFPGAFGHGMMYNRLKERQMLRFERDLGASGRGKDKRRILYISGVRSQESARRKKTTEILQVKSRKIFLAIIHNWGREECGIAREYFGLPRNPVSERLGKSGECLCGAFARKGELSELAFWYPDVAKRIKNLEMDAAIAGHTWGWEGQPPVKPRKPNVTKDLILCTSCLKNAEVSDDYQYLLE